MPETVNIALAQLSPRLRETEANIKMVRKIVAEHPEADLVVFPELFLSGYTLAHIDELAVQRDSPELKSVADIARESSTALIFGAAERVSEGIANSAFCVDKQGAIVGVYRKVQLYGGEESDAFVAGDELLIVELCGLKMGIMICFDVEFPEVARSLARAGAELLLTISANMEPFGNDHAVFVSARALENGLPHVYVNQVGPVENLTFVGGSTVVSSDGEIYAQASSSKEEIPSVRLLLPAKSNLREDYLSQLRSPMPRVKTVQPEAQGTGLPMARFSVNPSRFDPYKNFKFRVKWDGRYVAGVSKVGALRRTTEVVEQREGGDPSTSRKSPGRTTYEAITLERGVTHDTEFEKWANKVWNFGAGEGSEVSLADFRKDILIDFFNEAGQKVLSYKVYRCWVSEFQALPELDANANAVAIQTIKLENEGWERDLDVAEPAEPAFTEPPA